MAVTVTAPQLPKSRVPESPEAKQARRWLRRFATRALAVDPPLKTLPLGEDGFVQGTKLLAAARGDKDAPKVLTMKTLLAVIETSGGKLQVEHDSKRGLLVRGAVREQLEVPPEKKKFSEKDYKKLADDAKRETKKRDTKKQAENEKKRAAAVRSQEEQSRLRHERRQKRNEAARQRALKDPKNLRRIANPRKPGQLARIAPPLQRVGWGTSTADAVQTVKDRK